MARYKEKYRKLRRLTQKVRDWANAADKEFFELMADDGKLPKATQRAQDVAKFVPYHASKVSKEMLNLVNDRRLEIKEQAAEDRVALKEQAAADKLEQQEMAVTDMPEQEMAVVDTLYNIANSLDKKGLHKEADIVTETMVAIAAGKMYEVVVEGPYGDEPQFIGKFSSVEEAQADVEKNVDENLNWDSDREDCVLVTYDEWGYVYYICTSEQADQLFPGLGAAQPDSFYGASGNSMRGGYEAAADGLANIANSLDARGLYKEANMVTKTLMSIAAGEETGFYGHDYDDSKQSEPAVDEYGYKNDPSLSVGTCPDHRGTRLIPVDDRIYQCPIDGKIYNWAEGFTALDGTKYRGGDVAAQTPDSPSWTAAPPARWFEGQGR